MTSLALFTTSSTPRLFNNISDDEDDHPMCLVAKGNKVSNYSNPPSSPTSTSSEVEDDLEKEEAQHKENMIKKFVKEGCKQIKKLMEKLERKKRFLERKKTCSSLRRRETFL